MKILVTGVVGFIGFHCAKNLLSKNYDIVGIDNINNYYDVKLKNSRLKLLENDKLKFGLNYQLGESNPEFESNDELGVTMTTKLSDDILINGKLGVPIGGVTESVIAGDFEIELKLNEDRTLTMKIFNRENKIRNLGEQIGYTQGVGISYKVEFNSFKKLVNKLLAKPN